MAEEKKWTFDKNFTDYFSQGNYNTPTYRESSTVKTAKDALEAQLKQKPGAYQSQWQTQLNDVMDKIMNREKFSYDLNGDALYQQYKDKYIQQGKMASADVMGQAAAMTGGYGNSYAASVGNQAYQASLQNLNDIVPELYQLAYDRYAQEGQDLLNQYGIINDREDTDYNRYRDTVSDFNTERDYLTGRYDSERSYDYSKYTDGRDFAYQKYADDKNYAYTDHRNNIADKQWKDEYDLAVDKFGYEKEQANKVVIAPAKDDPKYLDNPSEIDAWSTALLGAEDQSTMMIYYKRLKNLDPELAFEYRYQWEQAHKKKVNTQPGGNADIVQVIN